MHKLTKLSKIIRSYGSCLIAFSGGLDSTFLLKAALGVLPKEKVLAVTADSVTYPSRELIFAKRIARKLDARHKVIRTREFADRNFLNNSTKRCYFCKRELFCRLTKLARQNRLDYVFDASNVSDKDDFRPGAKAKEEFRVKSPLVEAGLDKQDLRRLSRKFGLETWDKPAQACLASRIPYGIKISRGILWRIEEAEDFLKGLGLAQVRLRHYSGMCRIEVNKEDIPLLLSARQRIVDRLKKLGYNYVTLDLEGYRRGSLNI